MLIPHRSHEALEAEAHLKFDLKTEVAQLSNGDLQAGRNSRTLMKAPDLRVVLVTANKGSYLREHRADGSVTILAVAGAIRLKLEDGPVDLKPGELLALDRALPHDVEALSDCAFLVTIGWPKNV
jgi:quercetin dioxygenase-like cupin family protein